MHIKATYAVTKKSNYFEIFCNLNHVSEHQHCNVDRDHFYDVIEKHVFKRYIYVTKLSHSIKIPFIFL